MPVIQVAIENPDAPAWLPTPNIIVRKCRSRAKDKISGFEEHSPNGSESVWIKHGSEVDLGEARTQKYIADIVNSDEKCIVRVPQVYCAFWHNEVGYLVMEYVPGRDCNDDDLEAVISAVQRLWAIESPTNAPGPVGGGLIVHCFFPDSWACIEYDSIEALQDHVNRACPPS